MYKSIFAAVALALAVSFAGPATAQTARAAGVTDAHINYIKAVLKLTPAQQNYWPPVEAALRNLGRPQAAATAGMLQKVGQRGAALVVDMAQIRKLASVASPLIKSLNPTQKKDAVGAAKAMGFGHLAAAF
jgi:hypothetical protein